MRNNIWYNLTKWDCGGPAGIRTRVWGSGGLGDVLATLQAHDVPRLKRGARKVCLRALGFLVRWRSECQSLFLFELGVTTAPAGGSILMLSHEDARSTLGTYRFRPDQLISIHMVTIFLGHFYSSVLAVLMPERVSRYLLSSLFAVSTSLYILA